MLGYWPYATYKEFFFFIETQASLLNTQKITIKANQPSYIF
jgi:hypothetical protein